MSNRITLISLIEKNSINKVESLMNKLEEETCKVPYGINDEKRYEIDNLPYHFTIFATNKENQDRILKIAKKLKMSKIQLKVNDVKIMNARCNSYCLYLAIEESEQMKEMQKEFYQEFPQEQYNPEKFTFHMTLHIGKNKQKILEMQNKLKDNFKPFLLEFNTIALFDYPGEMIEVINFNKEN